MSLVGPNFFEALARFLASLPMALLITCIVTVGAVIVAIGVGLFFALLRAAAIPYVSKMAALVVYIGRCIPLPPLQFLIYFTLLELFRMDAILSGIIAVGLFNAAPMAEIFRSGIAAVPKGHLEAAAALGMSAVTCRRRVIIPIAIRTMLPPIGQMVVSTLISSAFVSQIGVKDITGMGRNIINDLFASELWLVVAFTYFIIAFPMSRILTWLERRLTIVS